MQHLLPKKIVCVAALVCAAYSVNGFCQKVQSKQVNCYISELKNPHSFSRAAGDIMELVDGTNWKLIASSHFTYTSYSSRTVLVCPDLGKVFTFDSAFSVAKAVKKDW